MREGYPTVEKLEKVIGKRRREKLSSIEIHSDVVEAVAADGYVDPNYPRTVWLRGHDHYYYSGGVQTKQDMYRDLIRFCDCLEHDPELYTAVRMRLEGVK